jgi:large subunit ribosomal protein L22
MGQSANPKRILANESRAFAKTLRVTPRKLGLVAGLIRGKSAASAMNALTFS